MGNNQLKLYFILCCGTGLVKIGHTNQNIGQRIASLQTGCPFELRALVFTRRQDARKIEKLLHAQLSHRHVRGEWFDLGFPPDICWRDAHRAVMDFVIEEEGVWDSGEV